jgi:AcrR family transcriptional regulator
VLELVSDGALDDLSVPAVAQRSGVSVATIYRYFPTRDELLTAAAAEPSRRALTPAAGSATRRRRPGDVPAGDVARLRPQPPAAAPSGRIGRGPRDAHRPSRQQPPIARRVRRRPRRRPDHAGGERLISLLLLINGSLALIELHDRQGLAVDEAIDRSLWAANALIDATRRSPDD